MGRKEQLQKELAALEKQEEEGGLILAAIQKLTQVVEELTAKECSRIMDQKEVLEYIDIAGPTFQKHKLAEKIPHVNVGRAQRYQKEVVDWFLYREAYKNIEDQELAAAFKERFMAS